MKDWHKEIGVAFFGNFLLIGIYIVCTYDNWYDPTNLFSEIMFFGAFFGFPIFIFMFDFYAMVLLSKKLKIRKKKLFFLKLLAYNMIGFAVFHSLLAIHGTIGNRFMENNVEKYVFDGDIDTYAKGKIDELEKDLGIDLQYMGSAFSTGFQTGLNQTGGSHSVEDPIELEISYKVDDPACNFEFCRGTQIYHIRYKPETFEAADSDIPLRERYVLAGVAGEYQEEGEGNYFYKVIVSEDTGYSTGTGRTFDYRITVDELSASGYWDKEATNFRILVGDEFPGKEIKGVVCFLDGSHLQHLNGKSAAVHSEGSKLIIRIEGHPQFTFYKKGS
ncbi:hypothetical protein [Planomicrobium sp. CPCC 101110]|uniref:hypothetical protein n=1 Tax=Planomicrobium sp. CPCC 101110 TaxID=2599619 RepID=UPI0011B8611B|nr:hypothetical protein [Planomicrobium sp. CPCC 101110]TWT26257.1 hypothetical protein FQV30_10770 [Planomicrobium sp. CPCC 101110]